MKYNNPIISGICIGLLITLCVTIFHPTLSPNTALYVCAWLWFAWLAFVTILVWGATEIISHKILVKREQIIKGIPMLFRSKDNNNEPYWLTYCYRALRLTVSITSIVAFWYQGWVNLATLCTIAFISLFLLSCRFRQVMRHVRRRAVEKGLFTWTELGWPEKDQTEHPDNPTNNAS